jgi:hypothetical protein
LNLVDDTPIVPGDMHPAFAEVEAARQVLTDAESDLQSYRLDVEPITSNAGHLGVGAMPGAIPVDDSVAAEPSVVDQTPGSRTVSGEQRYAETPYPVSDAELLERQEPVHKEVPTAV